MTRSGLSKDLKEVRGRARRHLGDQHSRQRKSRCKGSEAEMCLVYLGNFIEASVAGAREVGKEERGELEVVEGVTCGICRAINFYLR